MARGGSARLPVSVRQIAVVWVVYGIFQMGVMQPCQAQRAPSCDTGSAIESRGWGKRIRLLEGLHHQMRGRLIGALSRRYRRSWRHREGGKTGRFGLHWHPKGMERMASGVVFLCSHPFSSIIPTQVQSRRSMHDRVEAISNPPQVGHTMAMC